MKHTVLNKYSLKPCGEVPLLDTGEIQETLLLAHAAKDEVARLSKYARARILKNLIQAISANREDLIRLLIEEVGKPQIDSAGELDRMLETLELCVQLALSPHEAGYSLGQSPRSENYRLRSQRFPAGLLYFITPFNFPLNLLAHKLGPAIAAGCPFLIKPSPLAPLAAHRIEKLLHESGWPVEAGRVFLCEDQNARIPSESDLVRVVSFTGSHTVGIQIQKQALGKRVILELGGNACALLEPDWPLEDAVSRICLGAFYQSGQSCVSLQRLYVREELLPRLGELLKQELQKYPAGDPAKEGTRIGPMISEQACQKLWEQIKDAQTRGAQLLLKPERLSANHMTPAVLTDVPKDHPLMQEEAFGPVLCLATYQNPEEQLERLRDLRSGLQAGIFSNRIDLAELAFETLPSGAIMIGDVPSIRLDAPPYGGIGSSGIGKEGPHQAYLDFTEEKLMIVRRVCR